MNKFKKKRVQELILKLINPSCSEKTFLNSKIYDQEFWDIFIKASSANLLLPTVFISMKRKGILEIVPEDLKNYLNEIYLINFNRNKLISKQVFHLSKLLNSANIKHIFIKGAGLLVSNKKYALNERMIGDIDILIEKKKLFEARELLISNGYNEQDYDKVIFTRDIVEIEKRHLLRINNEKYICSVELHWDIIEKKYQNYLSIEKCFLNAITIDGVKVFNKTISWENAILNHQLNDHGFRLNFLHLRSVADIFNLEPMNTSEIISKSNIYIKHFYSLLSVYFNKYPNYYYFKSYLYKSQLRYNLIQKLLNILLQFNLFLRSLYFRVYLFLFSKLFRKRVFNNRNILFLRIIKLFKKLKF